MAQSGAEILCLATLLLCSAFATSFSTDPPLLQQHKDRVGRLPGPGCSSIALGQSEEIGPFHINSDGETLHPNPYSWNRVANIIFLETPVGVGFSYSNNGSDLLNNGDNRTAKDNLVFLLKWFERFPQYRRNDFLITGESYAGHYIPQLSQAIVKYNSATKEQAINLKGFMVGNALTDDYHDQLGMFEFMWSSGLISDQTYKLLNLLCDFESFEHPSHSCEKIWEIADKELGNIDPYSLFTPPCHAMPMSRIGRLGLSAEYDPCTERHSIVYFNRPEVQTALHVDLDHKPATWETCRQHNPLILIFGSDVVYTNWKDSPRSVLDIYQELIGMGLRIWVFREKLGRSFHTGYVKGFYIVVEAGEFGAKWMMKGIAIGGRNKCSFVGGREGQRTVEGVIQAHNKHSLRRQLGGGRDKESYVIEAKSIHLLVYGLRHEGRGIVGVLLCALYAFVLMHDRIVGWIGLSSVHSVNFVNRIVGLTDLGPSPSGLMLCALYACVFMHDRIVGWTGLGSVHPVNFVNR
ncbi:hypothetical protein VNO80_19722 [Phaseolus coccineus]|uniref:Carboxypeptidase n=1 Tax=Phaseolus coccineus TaxID=3886 RepID=A0AAN9MMS3_PHACN